MKLILSFLLLGPLLPLPAQLIPIWSATDADASSNSPYVRDPALSPDKGVPLFNAPDTTYQAGSGKVSMLNGDVHIQFPKPYTYETIISAMHGPTETLYLFIPGYLELFRITPDGRTTLLRTFTQQEVDGIVHGSGDLFRMSVGESGRYLYMWPDMLGNVTRLDLESMEMEVISNTRVRNLAAGHASLLMGEDRIHTFGGYGLWTHWNHLLFFDSGTTGWERLNSQNEAPSDFQLASLSFVHDEPHNRFHVLTLSRETVHPSESYRISAHEFDMATRTWSRPEVFSIPDSVGHHPGFKYPSSQMYGLFTGDQFDPETGWIAFNYHLFYDSRNRRFHVVDTLLSAGLFEKYAERVLYGIHFAPPSRRWVFVTRKKTTDSLYLIIHGLDMSKTVPLGRRVTQAELLAQSLAEDPVQPRTGWVLFFITAAWIVGGRLSKWRSWGRRDPSRVDLGIRAGRSGIEFISNLAKAMGGGADHEKQAAGQVDNGSSMRGPGRTAASTENGTKAIPSQPKGDDRLWIHELPDGKLRIFLRNEEILMADENFERLIQLLKDMKRKSRSDILLSDSDRHLFPFQSSVSNSRVRSKLITTFNTIMDREVLTIQRNRTDRRFRLLKVDLSKLVLLKSGADGNEQDLSPFHIRETA